MNLIGGIKVTMSYVKEIPALYENKELQYKGQKIVLSIVKMDNGDLLKGLCVNTNGQWHCLVYFRKASSSILQQDRYEIEQLEYMQIMRNKDVQVI